MVCDLEKRKVDLYDRQIRIWGIDIQVRLDQASVIVAGATELASEICKNLVLLGVGRLLLVDDGVTTEKDAAVSLFFSRHSISQKVFGVFHSHERD